MGIFSASFVSGDLLPDTLNGNKTHSGSTDIFQGAFPLVFGPPDGHGWNTGAQGLSFLGFMIDTLLAAAANPIQNKYYVRKLHEAGRGVPEARMWMAIWGSFLFPISLFWFGWTSYVSGRFMVM